MRFIRAAWLPLLTSSCVDAFTSPSMQKARRLSRILVESEESEPDLFDFFDPLLSPHAYPNGISPENKPSTKEEKMPPVGDFGPTDFISIMSAVKESTADVPPQQQAGEVPEVFDPLVSPHMYPNGTPDTIVGDKPTIQSSSKPSSQQTDPDVFDPLLSPHMYPKGTPDTVGKVALPPPPLTKEESTAEIPQVEEKTPIAPLKTSAFVSLLSSVSATSDASSPPPPAVVDPDYFDPLLSPHSYPNGTPDRFYDEVAAASPKRKLGILIMDHGSRNKASNDRLHEVARVYQESCNNDNKDSTTDIIVTAAHMEIAEPDIPTGLQTLLDAGVEEIVCHPYFLSAGGRHVSEDIPAILKEAQESLPLLDDIPLVLTPPVGSQTDLMIVAIQKLVQDAQTTTTTTTTKSAK